MPREIRFKKQYKPIGFGDRPDTRTVEGHRNALQEAADTRDYNRMMKGLAAKREAEHGGLLSKLMSVLGVGSRSRIR